MNLLIYNFGLSLFDLIIRFVSFFNTKAKRLVEGRHGTWSLLSKFSKENHLNVMWFHAASLGEFEQGRPIIERVKNSDPNVTILLSFFSPSGYEVRRNYGRADLVVYLPSDNFQNAKKFIKLANPKVAVFIKYEYWYHYLTECSENGVLTLSVSSIFRREQPFFKFYGSLHRKMLDCFDHVFVQDKNSRELLKALKVEKVSVSGDTRFDRVVDIVRQKKEVPEVEAFKSGGQIMVLGSVWPSDMDVLLPFFQTYQKELKFVIAPHNIGENDVQDIVDQIGNDAIRFSQIGNGSLANYRFLIVDNIGMLSSLYGYGEFAYVGGAFRKTLHNTLEAATHGVPVFFGDDPSNEKFREAGELEEVGAGFPVKGASDLISKFKPLLEDEQKRMQLGKAASQYVKNNTGATEMIVDHLFTHMRAGTKNVEPHEQ